ncbi:MAG: SUMF1/EgtB/PvdO family nonheme iron enzyme [Candidatus Coatesbacteria bacterium]|nr:SUMF1/EgtB/PvdO family nonheme iron enzyme [Candidatus Coatesbacteria bacterium]
MRTGMIVMFAAFALVGGVSPGVGYCSVSSLHASSASNDISIECSLNKAKFSPGEVLQVYLSAQNTGGETMVDVHVAFVAEGAIYDFVPLGDVPLLTGSIGPAMVFELSIPPDTPTGDYLCTASLTSAGGLDIIVMDTVEFSIGQSGPLTDINMISIPAGSFVMGSPESEEGRRNDEGPQRTVELPAFMISETEITEKQWEDVMGWNDSPNSLGDDYPVESITFFDCISFCNELSRLEGLSECYEMDIIDSSGNHVYRAEVTADFDADGYRLPTEAEWEYACRAGTLGQFCTGDSRSDLDAAGWHVGNSGSSKQPVGQKPANAFGLYDMHGNVWERCWDWYSSNYYDGRPAPDLDPNGPEEGRHRVLRGGCWYTDARHCRSASRFYYTTNNSSGLIGLRVVRRQQ